MKRRDFVSGLSLAAAVTACSQQQADCGPANGPSRETFAWNIVTSWPPGLPGLGVGVENLVRRIEKATNGRLKIKVFAGGELVPALEVLDAVSRGTVQMGHDSAYYHRGKVPAAQYFTTIPFGQTVHEINAWIYYGGGLELWRELYEPFNVIPFPAGNTGPQMGGWFNREINSLQDLRGLKMRIPGMGGGGMDQLGVTVQQIPSGEIYPALERGAIDAAEWVGPYDDEKLGFYKVAQHYYYPGWWEPGPALTFYVNRDAWDQLPTDYQHILEVASVEAGLTMMTRYDARNPAALQRLLDKGVQLHRFPDDVMQAARDAAAELLESPTSDPGYAKIYNAFIKWREDSYRWFGTAEQAYAAFAYGAADSEECAFS